MVVTSARRLVALATTGMIALGLGLGPLAGSVSGRSVAPPTAPIKVTQNYSDIINPSTSMRCSLGGGIFAENHWIRRFDISGVYGSASGFTVSEVVLAVARANSFDGMLPGAVEVSAIDKPDPLTVAKLELLVSVPVNYETVENETFMTVPVAAVVPAGKDMVIEIVVEQGTSGESFYLGANSSPEAGPDYLLAPPCGQTEPTDVTAIGFPTSNHLFHAIGKANDCLRAEAAVPLAEASVAQAAAAVTKASARLAKAKKKLAKARTKLRKAKESGNPQAITKAKKKVTKAKAKRKSAKQSLASALAGLAGAEAALSAANQAEPVECAQPTLPALARAGSLS